MIQTYGLQVISASFITPADSGETWVEQKSGVDSLLCDSMFIDDKNGWVAGIKGVMLHTADGGATWKRQDTGNKPAPDGGLVCRQGPGLGGG